MIEYIAVAYEVLALLITAYLFATTPNEAIFTIFSRDLGIKLTAHMFAIGCLLGAVLSLVVLLERDRWRQTALYMTAPLALILYAIPTGYYAGVTGRAGIYWFILFIFVGGLWINALSVFWFAARRELK